MFGTLFTKLGADFGTSSSHLSNFERVLGSKNGCARGARCVNPKLAYARLAWPSILVGQARRLVLNSPTLILVDDSLSIVFA